MNIESLAITLTQELVRIPSESSQHTQTSVHEPEKGVNEHLAALCVTRGVDFEFQEALPGRSNFIARFPKKKAPKLLIIAHSDTVSAKGADKPFSGELRDNKIWGRGACDDKGPMAAALTTLVGLHQQKNSMAYDITFAATVDEECSMSGAAALNSTIPAFDLCIGLEPTNLAIVNAHKGIHRCKITTKGLAAHSSCPEQGRNAIIQMHGIMADLQVMEFRLKRQRDDILGRSSLAITQIQGGTSVNIIPDHCEISVDTRLLPEHDPEMFTRQLEQVVGPRGIVSDVFFARGIQTEMDNQIVKKFQSAITQCGYPAEPAIASYATDCSQLIEKGPCIVWGPGDIAQAHQAGEFIDIAQIKDACRMLQMFLTSK